MHKMHNLFEIDTLKYITKYYKSEIFLSYVLFSISAKSLVLSRQAEHVTLKSI